MPVRVPTGGIGHSWCWCSGVCFAKAPFVLGTSRYNSLEPKTTRYIPCPGFIAHTRGDGFHTIVQAQSLKPWGNSPSRDILLFEYKNCTPGKSQDYGVSAPCGRKFCARTRVFPNRVVSCTRPKLSTFNLPKSSILPQVNVAFITSHWLMLKLSPKSFTYKEIKKIVGEGHLYCKL